MKGRFDRCTILDLTGEYAIKLDRYAGCIELTHPCLNIFLRRLANLGETRHRRVCQDIDDTATSVPRAPSHFVRVSFRVFASA